MHMIKLREFINKDVSWTIPLMQTLPTLGLIYFLFVSNLTGFQAIPYIPYALIILIFSIIVPVPLLIESYFLKNISFMRVVALGISVLISFVYAHFLLAFFYTI